MLFEITDKVLIGWIYSWAGTSTVVDVVGGMYFYAIKLQWLILPGTIIQTINEMIASIGTWEASIPIDMEDILFNRVPLTDINIFDFESAGDAVTNFDPLDSSAYAPRAGVLFEIREKIAGLYYAIRNLAIVLSLLVLIFIGIRMATSTLAEDKAKYKKMLFDWLVSFGLIFVLHYLMIFIIQLNDGIIEILSQNYRYETRKLSGILFVECFVPVFTRSTMASMLYLFLSVTTLFYLVVYIKRFITISFLVIISPLITVTYAIDKAGDGKAQALNKWLSEFMFNILIQPFHCIIYMVVLKDLYSVTTHTVGVLQFGKIFVAIVLALFIYKADDIVKSIFGFKANSLSSAAALGITTLNTASKAAKLVGGKSKGGSPKQKTPTNLPSGAAAPTHAPPPGGVRDKWSKTKSTLSKWHQAGYGDSKWDKFVRGAASKLAFGIIGAAATGNMAGASTANSIASSATNLVKNKKAAKERKEDAIAAYDDYKNDTGKDTATMMADCDRLLDLDKDGIEALTDDKEKNLAKWLHADMEAQDRIGAKDPKAAVMAQLAEHEGI